MIFLAVFRRSSALFVPAAINVFIAPVTAQYEVAIAFHRRQRRLILWSVLRLAQPLIWLGILCTAFVVGAPSAATLTYMQLIGHTLLAAVALRWLIRGVKSAPLAEVSNDLKRKSHTALVAQVFKVLTLRLDLLMLPFFATDVEVGWYAAATSWSWLATPWLSGLASSLAPTLQGGSRRMDRKLSMRLLTFGLVATAAIAALGWVATQLFFTFVYGEAYAPALGVASVLMAAGALTGFNLWAAELARYGGRMWLPAVAEFPSVLVFLFILLFWKSSWGTPQAAAIGSLFGYLTTAVIYAGGLLAGSSKFALTGVEGDDNA